MILGIPKPLAFTIDNYSQNHLKSSGKTMYPKSGVSKLTIFDYSLFVLLSAVGIWVTVGFFYPDYTLFYRFGNKLHIALWVIRIGTGIFFIGAISLYFFYKINRIKKSDFILCIVSTVLCIVLCFVVTNVVYSSKINGKKIRNQYHPFLQLTPLLPPDIQKGMIEDSIISVVCIGGSTTEWLGSDSIGWVTLLGEYLRERTGKGTIRTYNCGRQWYTSLHTLINYQTNLRHLHPDIIIYMHAINDLLHNADESYFSHSTFRNDYGHFYGPVNRIIENKGFIKDVAETFRIWYQKPRTRMEVFEFPGIVPFERNVHSLIDLAQLDSITVILMTQPTMLRQEMSEKERHVLHMVNVETCGPKSMWGYQSAYRGMEAYNNTTRSIAKSREVFLIDLEKKVPKNMTYFLDEVHYCDTTFRLIARHITDQFLQMNILDSIHDRLPQYVEDASVFKVTD